MPSYPYSNSGRGPFTASQIPDGSRYELSRGHALYCAPAGERHGAGTARGVAIIGTDPKVKSAGADVGFSPDEGTLRAPDVSVLTSEEPGWGRTAPPLAIEFADKGQDEQELKDKISELLDAGTQQVWVVRLKSTPCVEVHSLDEPIRLAFPGQELSLPEVLEYPVPVSAFFDTEIANQVALRNLLGRHGYPSLDAVRGEGRMEGIKAGSLAGRAQSLLEIFASRGLVVSEAARAQVLGCEDEATLSRWTLRAITASSTEEALSG